MPADAPWQTVGRYVVRRGFTPFRRAISSPSELIHVKARTLAVRHPVAGDVLLMSDARELRKLAEWYRAFAEVGHSSERLDRLKFADYLECRAEESERNTKREESSATTQIETSSGNHFW